MLFFFLIVYLPLKTPIKITNKNVLFSLNTFCQRQSFIIINIWLMAAVNSQVFVRNYDFSCKSVSISTPLVEIMWSWLLISWSSWWCHQCCLAENRWNWIKSFFETAILQNWSTQLLTLFFLVFFIIFLFKEEKEQNRRKFWKDRFIRNDE